MHNSLFVRLLLVGFLFLPTLAQHTHLLSDHDHPSCNENSLHFHSIDTSCDLLDYVFEFSSLTAFYQYSIRFFDFSIELYAFTDPILKNKFNCNQLRAPPV